MNNSMNDLTADAKFIFINQYNLFEGFPKTTFPLKNLQEYLYHVYRITKRTLNWILQQYYEREFDTERGTRYDTGQTVMNFTEKGINYKPFMF